MFIFDYGRYISLSKTLFIFTHFPIPSKLICFRIDICAVPKVATTSLCINRIKNFISDQWSEICFTNIFMKNQIIFFDKTSSKRSLKYVHPHFYTEDKSFGRCPNKLEIQFNAKWKNQLVTRAQTEINHWIWEHFFVRVMKEGSKVNSAIIHPRSNLFLNWSPLFLVLKMAQATFPT